MSEEPTHSARDIVLELFPATHERIVPSGYQYRLRADAQGQLLLIDTRGEALLTLTPITPAGSAQRQLCCDVCQRSAPRSYLQLFRTEVPGSGGRRYRYLSLCRDRSGCDARRLDDRPIEQLLEHLAD